MDILITGSVAYDYLMSFPGEFKDHILADQLENISLSFLVESLVRRRGGIAANIAYNLALLGGRARVLAAIGEDFREDREWLKKNGVDTSCMKVIPDSFTASFFATTDQNNSQMASFYPGAMAHAGELRLGSLDGNHPDVVMISPNDPGAMDAYIDECKHLGIPYIYDPSQQVVRVDPDTLRTGIESAQALFGNEYEFHLIADKTGLGDKELAYTVDYYVKTLGEKGAIIFAEGKEHHIPAVLSDHIADPTGGGDAFRGGFLSGMNRGFDWETCGKLGALAATYCLESEGSQEHSYSLAQFEERYAEHFGDIQLQK